MTTVESKEVVGDSTDNKEIKVDADDVDIPSDFFDEFEDSKFLDEIVEIVVPEQARLVRTDDQKQENAIETNGNKSNEEDATEPTLKRCLEKINDLTRSIERRKQRLQNNSLTRGGSKRKRRSHTRSPSPVTSRADRNVKSRDRDRRYSPRRSPSSRSNSGPRSGRRCRSRSRSRNRDRRSSRRDQPSNHQRIPFLEELTQTLAEKGLDFPEKDLLIQSRSNNNGGVALDRQTVATIGYPQMPISVAPYVPNVQMPMYNQPSYPPFWNGNYMINPMATSLQHTMLQHPFQAICAPNEPTANNVIHNDAKASE